MISTVAKWHSFLYEEHVQSCEAKNIPAKELRGSSSSEDEPAVRLLVVRLGGPTSVFRKGLWVQYATSILQVGFMLPKRFLIFLPKNNLHQNHFFLHATPSGPSVLVMVPRVWPRPVIAGLESSEKVRHSALLAAVSLALSLFVFPFFPKQCVHTEGFLRLL